MKILGLTGATGAGKSTTSALFKKQGVPVFDCDAVVHDLMQTNASVVKALTRLCPKAFDGQIINRTVLSDAVGKGEISVTDLENIIYPALIEQREAFLFRHADDAVVVIDAPTLFESGWDKRCDVIVSVSAPKDVLFARVMARPHMTAEKYAVLQARQINENERLKKSDYVVDSAHGEKAVEADIQKILLEINGYA